LKWNALMQENAPKIMKLYKTGRSGKIYPKTVYPIDWKGEYEPTVSSSSEQEEETTKGIQKFMLIRSQFPNNLALGKIVQKRMLQMVDLSPEELKQVEEAEEKAMQMPQMGQMAPAGQPGVPQGIPLPQPQPALTQ